MRSGTSPRCWSAGSRTMLTRGKLIAAVGDIRRGALLRRYGGGDHDEPHPGFPEDPGRLQPVLHLLHHSLSSGAGPLPAGRRRSLRRQRQFAAKGCRELVLTGIHIASYGKDCGPEVPVRDLAGVIRMLDGVAGIDRVRVGLAGAEDRTEEFVQMLSGPGPSAPTSTCRCRAAPTRC